MFIVVAKNLMHPTHPEPAMDWDQCLFLECVPLFLFSGPSLILPYTW